MRAVIPLTSRVRAGGASRGGARARAAPPAAAAAAPHARAPQPRPEAALLRAAAAALAAAAVLALSPGPAPAALEEAAAAVATAPATAPTAAAPPAARAAARAVSGALSRFLKSRHAADGGARLLGPVRASGDRLRQAADVLLDAEAAATDASAAAAKRGLRGAPPPVRKPRKGGGAATSASASSSTLLPPGAYASVLRLVRAASFECFSFDALDGAVALPGSLSAGGGGRCTLQIVAREAVRSLGQDQAALARATADEADALARALQLLDDRLDRASEGDVTAAAGVAEALERGLRTQAVFQGLVERCLFE